MENMKSDLQALATAVSSRAATHRAGLDSATRGEFDYLEGLVDAYEICYNQIMEILNEESN
jgi:hypothetical protein